jgi:hypothetical protein
VAENWSEVTLKQQIQISKDTDAILMPELKRFAILSAYAGIPIPELKQANLSELTEVFKSIKFINEDLPTHPITFFEFNGKKYHCGQNLIEMQFQDFISIENILAENSGNTQVALPTILAIMCKQVKDNGQLETIDDYDIAERAKEFELLPITIAHSLSLFFSTSEKVLSNTFPLFLNPENQQVIMQKQIDTVESMLKELAGKGLLMRCVAGILRIYLKSIKRKQDNLYTFTA